MENWKFIRELKRKLTIDIEYNHNALLVSLHHIGWIKSEADHYVRKKI